jgi:type I restriction enzyme R subunit
MQEMNLPFKPLVAFSGTVKDDGKEHTENSLNRLQAKVKIEDAFKLPEYRILVVANNGNNSQKTDSAVAA